MFDFVRRVCRRAVSSMFEGAEKGYCASVPAAKPSADDTLDREDRNFERLDAVREVPETTKDVHDHPAEASHILQHAGIGHMEGTPGVLIWDLEHGGADFAADLGGGLLGMVAKAIRNVAMRAILDRHGGSEPASPSPALVVTDLPRRSALRHTLSDDQVFGTDTPPPPGPS